MERCYTELSKLRTFEERFEYLRLNGQVAKETFGYDRYLNQTFYSTREWKTLRRDVILRDNGCDLGIYGRDIFGRVMIHHLNPIAVVDIIDRSDFLLLPEFLITTAFETHNAIHYGDESLLVRDPIERRPYDTSPWRH